MPFFTILFLLELYGVIVSATPINDEARIIGGEDAPYAYAPHMAALALDARTFLCGGSVISKRLILTAAHCIEFCLMPNWELIPTFHGRVGSNYWNSGGTVVNFQSFHMHPQYDRFFIKYDAGVLVLDKDLAFDEYLQVIPINYDFVEEERSFVTGWGLASPRIEDDVIHLVPTPIELQLLYVNTMNHDQCQRLMHEVSSGFWTPPIEKNAEICTLHSRGHGMCSGDSGSGLVKAATRELIGIVSWGFGCAEGAPDVFVRIYGIRDFIEELLKKYQQ